MTITDERRLVTVLFADLVGFTGRAESSDPEEIRELQRAYFAVLAAEVERYGGSVEKYIGDAAMALFGAPQAHDDDAERALRAALAIREGVSARSAALPVLEREHRLFDSSRIRLWLAEEGGTGAGADAATATFEELGAHPYLQRGSRLRA